MKSASRSLIDLKVVVSDLLERLPVPETVAVVWEMPDGLSRVSADRLHVEQILTNLITNAVQAMPDGGTLTIAGRAEPTGGVLSLPPRPTGNAPLRDLPALVHDQAQGHRPWPGSGETWPTQIGMLFPSIVRR
jgi:signal transduction histidine kinase